MKKLGGLVALLTCVTIGGVYATWTYSETTNILDGSTEVFVTIADAVDDGANGAYSVSTNFKLLIDQKAANDHTAVLRIVKPGTTEEFTGTGGDVPEITIKFTPSLGASSNVKENAVTSYYYVSTSLPMQFECDANGYYKPVTDDPATSGVLKDIFKLPVHDEATRETIDWTGCKQTETIDGVERNVFVYTITGEEAIKGLIDIDVFKLDTLVAYNVFSAALTGKIVIHVTDGTADTAQNSNS